MLPPADSIIHSSYQNNMLLGHFLQYIAQQNLAPANADTLAPGSVVMEIKYGTHIPLFLRKLTDISCKQLSVSKYALCRERVIF